MNRTGAGGSARMRSDTRHGGAELSNGEWARERAGDERQGRGRLLAAVAAGILLALTALPTAATAGKRALYSADGVTGGAGAISQFLTPGAGAPTPLSPPRVATGADPQHVTIT